MFPETMFTLQNPSISNYSMSNPALLNGLELITRPRGRMPKERENESRNNARRERLTLLRDPALNLSRPLC